MVKVTVSASTPPSTRFRDMKSGDLAVVSTEPGEVFFRASNGNIYRLSNGNWYMQKGEIGGWATDETEIRILSRGETVTLEVK